MWQRCNGEAEMEVPKWAVPDFMEAYILLRQKALNNTCIII